MSGNPDNAMFPARMRKSPNSLCSISEGKVIEWLLRLVDKSPSNFWRNVVKNRKYLRKNLPAHLRSMLLDKLIPYYDKFIEESKESKCRESCKDIEWQYPCVLTSYRHSCRMHDQCRILWKRCDRILELVFAFDTNKLRLDFKKIRVEDHANVLQRIIDVIKQPAPKGKYQSSIEPRLESENYNGKTNFELKYNIPSTSNQSIEDTLPQCSFYLNNNHMPQLCQLSLAGGTVHTDKLLPQIEDLTVALTNFAPALKNLRLPTCSNHICKNLAHHPRLTSFVADRSQHFDRRGLRYLCHSSSYTSINMKILHIFVSANSSKHKLTKIDAARFLQSMQNLTDFSFMDETRKIIMRNEGDTTEKDELERVFIYSAFRICIIDEELDQLHQRKVPNKRALKRKKSGDVKDVSSVSEFESSSTSNQRLSHFQSQLSEIKIVDRQLKPKYLLKHAPNLKSLYIDWQEQLNEAPFHRFDADWFSNMLHHDHDWNILGPKLSKLDIVFPSTYHNAAYSLPVADCGALITSCPNILSLRLVGAGLFAGPIPLLLVLKTCRKLEKLVLEKSEIHFPTHLAQNIISSNVSTSLKCFHYVGDVGNIAHISRNVANFIPNLEELQLQPYYPSFRFPGLLPKDVSELNVMKHLRNLSIPLALHAFMMNMPEMVYILRHFQSLRNLTLSWGSSEENYTYSSNRILYMMRWLTNAITCENANINVQLCFDVHQDIYVGE